MAYYLKKKAVYFGAIVTSIKFRKEMIGTEKSNYLV